jgi:hypothetical protein
MFCIWSGVGEGLAAWRENEIAPSVNEQEALLISSDECQDLVRQRQRGRVDIQLEQRAIRVVAGAVGII